MSVEFGRLLVEVQTRLAPAVRGQAETRWGAGQPEFRVQIRTALAEALPDADCKDLQIPPRPRTHSVSISHTQNLGGWMSVPRPLQVGWDVEVQTRIKHHVIERISTAEELSLSPQPTFLWPTKESFYKALEDDQPLTITELTIDTWQSLGPDLWSWRGIGPRNGSGLLLQTEKWLLAACLID